MAGDELLRGEVGAAPELVAEVAVGDAGVDDGDRHALAAGLLGFDQVLPRAGASMPPTDSSVGSAGVWPQRLPQGRKFHCSCCQPPPVPLSLGTKRPLTVPEAEAPPETWAMWFGAA